MSLVREKQIKTTMRYHYPALEWPKSRPLMIPNAGEDVEQQKLSLIAGGHAKGCSHFGRQSGGFLQK